MIATALERPRRSAERIPPLENGDHLTAAEFLRRYEAMPEVRKAELINGVVYVPSPVRVRHGESDALIQTWLGNYALATPGTTDAKGYYAAENVHKPGDLAASLHTKMGIDPSQVLHTNTGRPVQLVNGGRLIKELFG